MEINPLHEREMGLNPVGILGMQLPWIGWGVGKNLSVWNGGWMNLTDCDDGVRCAVLFLLYSNAVALCTSVLHRFVLVLCSIAQYATYTCI